MRFIVLFLALGLSGCIRFPDFPTVNFPAAEKTTSPGHGSGAPLPPVKSPSSEPIKRQSAFDAAFAATERSEGGLVRHVADRGGLTYRGISERAHPDWVGWGVIRTEMARHDGKVRADINQRLDPLVREFYRKGFWNPLRLDEMDRDIAILMFDIGVNMGVGTAGCFMQRALNGLNRGGRDYPDLVVDCQIGSATVEAVRTFIAKRGTATIYIRGTAREVSSKWILMSAINVQKWMRWATLVQSDPTQEAFANGWTVRGMQDIVTALDRAGVIN